MGEELILTELVEESFVPEPAPITVVNGVPMSEEDYAKWLAMLEAVIEGERAESEAYEKELELIRPLTAEEVLGAILSVVGSIVGALPDEAIGRMQPYFPKWAPNTNYIRHQSFVSYGEGDGYVWRCETTHTSQADWTPDASPSLWSKVLTSHTDILPWEQPASTNPYMKGDKVLWDGKVWESEIDNNVWMPGVYGWKEVSE